MCQTQPLSGHLWEKYRPAKLNHLCWRCVWIAVPKMEGGELRRREPDPTARTHHIHISLHFRSEQFRQKHANLMNTNRSHVPKYQNLDSQSTNDAYKGVGTDAVGPAKIAPIFSKKSSVVVKYSVCSARCMLHSSRTSRRLVASRRSTSGSCVY